MFEKKLKILNLKNFSLRLGKQLPVDRHKEIIKLPLS